MAVVVFAWASRAEAHDFLPIGLEIRSIGEHTYAVSLRAPNGVAVEPELPSHCAYTSLPVVRSLGDVTTTSARLGCSGDLAGHPIPIASLYGREVVVLAEMGGRTISMVHRGPGPLVLPQEPSVTSAVAAGARVGLQRMATPLGLAMILAALLLVRSRAAFAVGVAVGSVLSAPLLGPLAIAYLAADELAGRRRMTLGRRYSGPVGAVIGAACGAGLPAAAPLSDHAVVGAAASSLVAGAVMLSVATLPALVTPPSWRRSDP